jgi:hypothetical protein
MTLDNKAVVGLLCTGGLLTVIIWAMLLTGACATGAF